MNYESIGQQYKVPSKTVEKLHGEVKAELSSSLSGEELEKTSIEILHGRLRERNSAKAELYLGVVVGFDIPRDFANPRNKPSRRALATEAFVANPEEAIAKGMVALLEPQGTEYKRTMLSRKTGKVETDTLPTEVWKEYIITVKDKVIVPLDEIKKWGTGADNIGYLKPLPTHKYNTTIEGIVKTDKGYDRFSMNWDQPNPPTIPVRVPVEFRAIKKDYKDGVLILKSSKYTEFVPTDKTVGDVGQLTGVGYSKIRMPIGKLVEYHTGLKNKFESLVLVEGWVRDMNLTTTIPYIKIDDLTTPMDAPILKVNIHEGIPVDFAYESKVLVLGRTREVDEEYRESQGDVVVWAMGIVSLFNTKKQVEPITEV